MPEGTVEQAAGQRSRQEEAEWLNVKTGKPFWGLLCRVQVKGGSTELASA